MAKFKPVLLINSAGDPVEARTAADVVNYKARGYRVQEVPAKAETSDERPEQQSTEADKRPRRSS